MNITRFIHYSKLQLSQRYKQILMELGVAAIAFFIIYGILINSEPNNLRENQGPLMALFLLSLFGLGCYIAGRWFVELQNTTKGFLSMQLPVTSFERLLLPVLITGPAFVFVFYGLFELLSVSYHFIWCSLLGLEYTFHWIEIKNLGSITLYYTLAHSIFMIGATGLRKFHFVKTGIIIGFTILLFFLLYLVLTKAFVTNYQSEWLFDKKIINENSGWIIWSLASLVNYYISWLKLKEKEV